MAVSLEVQYGTKDFLVHADEHTLRRNLRSRRQKALLENGLAKVREGITSLSELRRMGAGME